MTLTNEDNERIDRLIRESTAKIPQRAYPDDVLWLIGLLKQAIDETNKG